MSAGSRTRSIFRRIGIGAALSVLSLYLVLIASLFYFFDLDNLWSALSSPRVRHALGLSLLAATIASILALALALPAAHALSRHSFALRDLADAILELPMIVSPAALGAMALIFFQTPAGEFLQRHGIQFVFTLAGIVLAQFLTVLGIAIRLLKSVLDEIPARYEQIARTLGATPAQAFRRVVLPLSWRGIAATFFLVWAKAIGEFGATITVAGAMPMRTETLPVAIFMRLSVADIAGTVALILLLIFFAGAVLFLVRRITKTRWYA
jgi:molybdate transport system permease protein